MAGIWSRRLWTRLAAWPGDIYCWDDRNGLLTDRIDARCSIVYWLDAVSRSAVEPMIAFFSVE